MKLHQVTRKAFAGAVFLWLLGCQGGADERRISPEEEPPSAPLLQVEPPPGNYSSYALDVTVSAVDDGIELSFGLNDEPSVDDSAWYQGTFTVRLLERASLNVLIRDAAGKLWGPYPFSYTLASRDPLGYCKVEQPALPFFNPSQAIPIEVRYSLPTALASVELLVDGLPVAEFSSDEKPRGVATLPIPPLGVEKSYEVGCRIVAPALPDLVGNTVFVRIDATPPSVSWAPLGPWQFPSHVRITAADEGGAGVASAALCESALQYCLPMQRSGDVFTFATALSVVQPPGFSLYAVVFDWAGNRTAFPLPTVRSADTPDAAPAALLPITFTASPVIDLAAYLVANMGSEPDEVRSFDGTELTPGVVNLTAGWNEFLFRLGGRANWETVGFYHAGVEVELPPRDAGATHHWLVFASNSTTVALQATLVAQVPVTAGTWSRPWFDIPRLFFVEDTSGNGRWDDGEALWVPDGEDGGGPWLQQVLPLQTSLVEVPQVTGGTNHSVEISCADCSVGGALRGQRRASPYGAPVTRVSFPGVDLATVMPATVTYSAEAGERCLFYWDEDLNGVANGQEPRAFSPCGTGSLQLVRRKEPFSLALAGTELHMRGIPYGGSVTGTWSIESAASEVLLTVPFERVHDQHGTGERSVPLPSWGRWPSRLNVWADGDESAAVFPGVSSPVTSTVMVAVRDENGSLLSAAIQSYSPAITDFQIFTASQSSVSLATDPEFPSRLRALRDGYVGVWEYIWGPGVTLSLLSPAVTGEITGFVRDDVGNPLAGALIMWESYPYSSLSRSESNGTFRIPALGEGTLTASVAEPDGARVSRSLILRAGESSQVNFSLPQANEARWPAGLVSSPERVTLSGPTPATLYTSESYAWASLDAGEWRLERAPGLYQSFQTPGGIPDFQLDFASSLSPSWNSALLEATLWLRCGTRVQEIEFGRQVRVDVPCWDWFATWQGETYFMGRPDPQYGFPEAGLATLEIQIKAGDTPKASQAVRLRDLLFGHVLDLVTDPAGLLRVAVPFGYYQLEAPDGRLLLTEIDSAAYVRIYNAVPVSQIVYWP